MKKFTENLVTCKGIKTYNYVSNTNVTKYIKMGFTSLGSTYSMSFYLIYQAHLMKWEYLGALVYYPSVTNPLYNTNPTWTCSIITTHVCKAGDGSIITQTSAVTANVHYYVFKFIFETNSGLHPKAFYISGFVVWRILQCT